MRSSLSPFRAWLLFDTLENGLVLTALALTRFLVQWHGACEVARTARWLCTGDASRGRRTTCCCLKRRMQDASWKPVSKSYVIIGLAIGQDALARYSSSSSSSSRLGVAWRGSQPPTPEMSHVARATGRRQMSATSKDQTPCSASRSCEHCDYYGTMPKRKTKSVAFATPSSPKRRKQTRQKGTTTGCKHGAQEDVFLQKIHARPINDKYVLHHKLGEGGFGQVFLGIRCLTPIVL